MCTDNGVRKYSALVIASMCVVVLAVSSVISEYCTSLGVRGGCLVVIVCCPIFVVVGSAYIRDVSVSTPLSVVFAADAENINIFSNTEAWSTQLTICVIDRV